MPTERRRRARRGRTELVVHDDEGRAPQAAGRARAAAKPPAARPKRAAYIDDLAESFCQRRSHNNGSCVWHSLVGSELSETELAETTVRRATLCSRRRHRKIVQCVGQRRAQSAETRRSQTGKRHTAATTAKRMQIPLASTNSTTGLEGLPPESAPASKLTHGREERRGRRYAEDGASAPGDRGRRDARWAASPVTRKSASAYHLSLATQTVQALERGVGSSLARPYGRPGGSPSRWYGSSRGSRPAGRLKKRVVEQGDRPTDQTTEAVGNDIFAIRQAGMGRTHRQGAMCQCHPDQRATVAEGKAAVKKQPVQALSSGEAEFCGTVRCACWLLGLRALPPDVGLDADTTQASNSPASEGLDSKCGADDVRHTQTLTLWLQHAVAMKIIEANKKPGTERRQTLE